MDLEEEKIRDLTSREEGKNQGKRGDRKKEGKRPKTAAKEARIVGGGETPLNGRNPITAGRKTSLMKNKCCVHTTTSLPAKMDDNMLSKSRNTIPRNLPVGDIFVGIIIPNSW